MDSSLLTTVFEFVISMVLLIGGGLFLFYQPNSQAIPFVTGLMGIAVTWWFSKRTTVSTAQQVTKATNGALSATVKSALADAGITAQHPATVEAAK